MENFKKKYLCTRLESYTRSGKKIIMSILIDILSWKHTWVIWIKNQLLLLPSFPFKVMEKKQIDLVCTKKSSYITEEDAQNYESGSFYRPPTTTLPPLLTTVLHLFGMWAHGSMTPEFIPLWKADVCSNKSLSFSKVFSLPPESSFTSLNPSLSFTPVQFQKSLNMHKWVNMSFLSSARPESES